MTTKIKFNHSLSGKISVNQGVTPMCDLLTLGALVCTAKSGITDKRMPLSEYQTDQEGLEFLRDRSSAILNFLQDGITNIGVLLACHGGVLFDDQVTDIAELISGLSELSRAISEELVELNHSYLIQKAGDLK